MSRFEGKNDFYFKHVEIKVYVKHVSSDTGYPVADVTLRFRS